jgi:ABC-type multidrug transport system fused ATPase/permease subunit
VEPENRLLLHFYCVFYNIDEGEIVDEKYLYDFDLESLRGNMSMSQDVILFGGTIRENIAYENQMPPKKKFYFKTSQCL